MTICMHLYCMHAAARSNMCAARRDCLLCQCVGARFYPAVDKGSLDCGHRHAWDSATGKLSTAFNAQAEKAVGLFSSRAANPVVQAASADATEAVVWEVRQHATSKGHGVTRMLATF